MSVEQAVLERTGAPERSNQLLGIGLSCLVHMGVILLFVLAGRASKEIRPEPQVMNTTLVTMDALVRKGRKADPNLLPRLSNAPAPPPEEVVHLAPKPPAPVPEEQKDKEEQEKKAREEKERQRKMRQALASLHSGSAGNPDDPRKFQTDELPTGDPNGSELGTATKGRLVAGYADLLAAALKESWAVSFLSPEQMMTLCGVIEFNMDVPGRMVRSWKWVRRSGNREFDDSVEGRLKRHMAEGDSRFPPVPDEKLFPDGKRFIVGFTKNERLMCP